MNETGDGKSLLFQHLLNESTQPQTQNVTIMDLFRNAYRVPLSTFDLGKGVEGDEVIKKLDEIKKLFEKVKERLNERKNLNIADEELSSISEVEILIENLCQLRFDALAPIKETWDSIKKKLKQISFGEPVEINVIESLFTDIDPEKRATQIKQRRVWILKSTAFLKNVAKDILLITRVEADGWDPTVLKEVLLLVQFLWTTLQPYRDKLKLPNQVITLFGNALDEIESNWKDLIDHLKEREENKTMIQDTKLEGSQRISAKTVRELYILNELSRKVLHKRLVLIDTSAIQQTVDNIRTTLEGLELSSSKQDEAVKITMEPAWAPYTIVIVLDSSTGLLLTGATQAICTGYPLFRQEAKSITEQQLGEEYSATIKECNKHWRRICHKMITSDGDRKAITSNEGRRALLQELKPDVYNQIPASEEGSKIFSWAIAGLTFNPKSPCSRCRYFYTSWKTPTLRGFDEVADLNGYMTSGLAHPSENNEFHCAETIAAAGIYASRKGTLVLG